MHLFSKLRAPAMFVVFGASLIVRPLYPINLNPVQWSLHAELGKVGPGSTVVLRLHAQIAEGYHLYSFTTPAGGPTKTTVSIHDNLAVMNFRIYQPKPDRHQDLTLNVPVETFERGVDFLASGKLPKKAVPGDALITASVRYQACSDNICLPPVTKTVATSVTVRLAAIWAKATIPDGYSLVNGPGLCDLVPGFKKSR